MTDARRYFDTLYGERDDPWLLRERWYERRKRALTLAMLPEARYARAYEPGCANGELTVELASRCDWLLAADLNAQAVGRARLRVAQQAHVHVEQRAVPDEWPDGAFDLIVLSEIAYYLDTHQQAQLAQCLNRSVTTNGVVIACHWRQPIEGWSRTGDDVHAQLRSDLHGSLLAHYEDDDMLIDVWSPNGASVHMRENK